MTNPLLSIGQAARRASRPLARASTAQKNACLLHLAAAIEASSAQISAANQLDLKANSDLPAALRDRLTLSSSALQQMSEGLRQIADLPDPVGVIEGIVPRPSGIAVGQMRVPLGVIGVIYEARPNVTIDAAGLCIKSGNAVILRGGSEAIHCNRFLADLIQKSLVANGLPAEAVQLIPTTERSQVTALVQLSEYVDVIVPRGGKELIAHLMRESRIPLIKHLDGVCHSYVDAHADLEMALEVCFNAKCQRYGTCNTMEALLVDDKVAAAFLPRLAARVVEEKVELRACERALPLLQGYPYLRPATPADWGMEFLAPILAVKVVAGLDEAIDFINQHSSHHTDAILTQHYQHAQRFLREVDSASVMVNASTRFADGFEYGLGAEIGISNDKIHARGPVGLLGLTNLKYIVLGQGEVRR